MHELGNLLFFTYSKSEGRKIIWKLRLSMGVRVEMSSDNLILKIHLLTVVGKTIINTVKRCAKEG